MYEGIIKIMSETEGLSLEAVEARAVAGVPLRRPNEPDDIADMVVFLASSRSRNITGQSFNVDGGLIPD
jgi:2-hydroxycyclohexanecarboxyl-CoA dehydrogenase